MQIDLPQLAEEAQLREQRSRKYLLIAGIMIVAVASGFIWLTW
jgi:hypothetical protein